MYIKQVRQYIPQKANEQLIKEEFVTLVTLSHKNKVIPNGFQCHLG